jgi:hypothetical protein
MVVVPSLAKGDQGQQEIVATRIRRVVPATANHVIQGIDGAGAMEEDCG